MRIKTTYLCHYDRIDFNKHIVNAMNGLKDVEISINSVSWHSSDPLK